MPSSSGKPLVPRTRTLLHSWDALASQEPSAPALIEAGQNRVFTRAALSDLAQSWAATLHSSLPLKGARVAFALPNGAAWVATFLGLLRRGAIPLPLDASEPLDAQRELARQGGAAYLWSGDALEPLVSSAAARPARGLCVVKLTSGTTGTPRPLLFTDAEMLADARQICATMGIGPDDINLAIVPFGHSYGLGNLLVPLLAQGTAALCVSAPLPHALAADIGHWQPTVFPAVPALLRVLSQSDLKEDAFAPVRVILSAGSPLSAEVAQAFYQKYHGLIHGFYGSSETGGIAYDRSGEATLAGRSVGTPLEGVRLTFGPEQRFEVGSAAVFTRGNRQRAETGQGRFSPADRGELNASGELVLLGRAGRMMKIAGRRIDLTELEQTLKTVKGIRDAVVVPHPERPEELAAALATSLPIDAVRALLREKLAAWKLPRRLLLLPEFPLTSRGKTDTATLRERLGPSLSRPVPGPPPS